jgi:8-oxo-dGTP pyrophosphatase MutT (NUDIX family)
MAETGPKSEIAFRGKLFEVEQVTQPDGRVFEIARRAPGVRVIIPDTKNKKILLTKEFRRELNDWDLRLPGGKVFDSLKEYDNFRKTGQDIIEPATKKAIDESAEEAGVEIESVEFLRKSTLGATVEWDLYIFEATNWQHGVDGQQLESGEQIEADNWVFYDQAQKMILDGKMQEERVALILLQWLNQNS